MCGELFPRSLDSVVFATILKRMMIWAVTFGVGAVPTYHPIRPVVRRALREPFGTAPIYRSDG